MFDYGNCLDMITILGYCKKSVQPLYQTSCITRLSVINHSGVSNLELGKYTLQFGLIHHTIASKPDEIIKTLSGRSSNSISNSRIN